MGAIRIIIADSQFLTRKGFRHLFREDDRLEVVGEAANGADLLAKVGIKKPDIVVFDYHNSETFEIEDIGVVRKAYPQTGFLIVTADELKGNIFKVLEYGVSSILTKNCSEEEILAGVRATARAEKFFCNKVLEVILERQLGPEDDEDVSCAPSNLTAREIEIVTLIANGISTKEIASQLCLSTHTIYTHRKNIMKKLNINSVSEMVLYAINSGIVKPSEN
ncbi:MAG: response regulator transcription factor [Bacteroidota bacterium]